MERKTKIKHSHSTMRRYGATRGRESSCNIPPCRLCCTDLYGPLLLCYSHRQITKSEGPVTGVSSNEMGYCLASDRSVIQSPPHSAVVPSSLSLFLQYQLVSSPIMAAFIKERSVNDPLFDSVWRAQEELWCAQGHGSGETGPPPATPFLSYGIGTSQPT